MRGTRAVEIGVGEKRATALFRRWSDLSSAEMRELRVLWDERMRVAKRRAVADANRVGP